MNTKSIFFLIATLIAAQIFAMGSALAETIDCNLVQGMNGFQYEQVKAAKSINLQPGQSETLRDNASEIAATITAYGNGRYTMAIYHPGEDGLEPISFSYASSITAATLTNEQKQIALNCSKGH